MNTATDESPAKKFFEHLRVMTAERRLIAERARTQSLPILLDVMRHKTNQSAHVRALLFSLWNGKETSLIEILALDWRVRVALLDVVLAFGFEQKGGPNFFYDELQHAITVAGLWDWFTDSAFQKGGAA